MAVSTMNGLMMVAGHVLIGVEDEVVSMDAAFCDMMRVEPAAMLGRRVVDVTAPADREECAAAFRRLRDTLRPFVIIKRLIRGDETCVWVRNTVSITIADGAEPVVIATVEAIEAAAPAHDPAALLDVARFVAAARQDRSGVCDRALFSEPGWDTVLAAYIAEAEGRAIDVVALATALGHAPSAIARWVKALVQRDVLEIEYARTDADTPKAYRLTATTHVRLEAYLARINPFASGRIVPDVR